MSPCFILVTMLLKSDIPGCRGYGSWKQKTQFLDFWAIELVSRVLSVIGQAGSYRPLCPQRLSSTLLQLLQWALFAWLPSNRRFAYDERE